MAVEWTEEKVELLTELWKEGQSARLIAEQLGDGVTRNAVIGKANRLGLSKPSKSSETRKQRTQEKIKTKLQAPEGGATILSLTGTTCRWPIGDPGDVDFRGFAVEKQILNNHTANIIPNWLIKPPPRVTVRSPARTVASVNR
jgi:GcrA cell cycle regulator